LKSAKLRRNYKRPIACVVGKVGRAAASGVCPSRRRPLSNKAIARRLGITEGTVKTHVATIFDVLNVHNRVSAVAAARALVDEDGNPRGP
jgi:hypothetical protein